MNATNIKQPYSINICLSLGAFCGMLFIIFSSLTSHLPDTYFTHEGRNMCRIADYILAIHGLGLIMLSISQKLWQNYLHFTIIGGIFLLGIFLFCTGVYYFALTGYHPPLPIAPMGGSLLIIGWIYLCLLALFLK